MLQYAVDEANDKMLQDSGMRLDIATETIPFGREYMISDSVCSLLQVNNQVFIEYTTLKHIKN